MKPLISVIIPVYNVEKYLKKCLDSIISQTLKEIEIIVINDGSTDNSGKILDKYAKNDNRLIVIHKDNEGVSEARNEGLKYVHGDFVSFIDSDDWVEPEMYEVMYNAAIEKKVEIVMCGYVREFVNHSKIKIMDIQDGSFMKTDEIQHWFVRRMIGPIFNEKLITENLDMHSVVWNKIYRTHLVKNNTFCSLKEIGSCEDLLFNLVTCYQANSIMYINRSYYHYRKTSVTSVSSSYRTNLLQQRCNLIEKVRMFINQNNCPIEYHEALNNRICLGVMGLGLNIISRNNNSNLLIKIKQIKNMLSSNQITFAFQTFNSTKLSPHWKMFYFFAKNKMAVCCYFMLKVIKLLIVIIK